MWLLQIVWYVRSVEGKYRDKFRDMEQHKCPVLTSFLLASPAESRTSDVDIMDAGITNLKYIFP